MLGPILLLLAAVLISACTTAYFRHVAPLYTEPVGSWGAAAAALTSAGLFALGNLVYNYARCVGVDPGTTPGMRYRQILEASDPAVAALPPQASHEVAFCRTCNAAKPRRVHHCSVCNKCVIKMGAWGGRTRGGGRSRGGSVVPPHTLTHRALSPRPLAHAHSQTTTARG